VQGSNKIFIANYLLPGFPFLGAVPALPAASARGKVFFLLLLGKKIFGSGLRIIFGNG
jgi:hypothetical protein